MAVAITSYFSLVSSLVIDQLLKPMKQIPLSVVILLSIVCGLRAQTAPDAAELTKLLKDFLAGAGQNDVAMHDRFWADDLIYTASAGHRKSKADIMRELRKEGPPKLGDETVVYTAEDIRIQQYSDTAIVAFRLVATNTEKDGTKKITNYLNSGTFLKRDGKWQVVNWQATTMAKPTEKGPSE